MQRILLTWCLCGSIAAIAAADSPPADPVGTPTAPTGTKPATADAAPAPTKFVPGVVARIYLLPADTEWPPASLPKAPGEVLKLATIPEVKSEPVGDEHSKRPNTLVQSKMGILEGVRFYVVQFQGWIYATVDGEYGFVVRSNGPYLLSIEDQEIVRSAYFFDYSKLLRNFNGRLDFYGLPPDAKFTNTMQGSAKLTAHRYYHLALTCYQQHGELAPGSSAVPEVLKAMGAELATVMTTPDGDSTPLLTYVPESPKPEAGR